MLQRLFNKTGYLFPSYFPQLIPRFYLLLIEARTACDVWNTATHLFVVVTSTKLSRLRHDLHLASFSSEPLLLQCLIDVLLENESRQVHTV